MGHNSNLSRETKKSSRPHYIFCLSIKAHLGDNFAYLNRDLKDPDSPPNAMAVTPVTLTAVVRGKRRRQITLKGLLMQSDWKKNISPD